MTRLQKSIKNKKINKALMKIQSQKKRIRKKLTKQKIFITCAMEKKKMWKSGVKE